MVFCNNVTIRLEYKERTVTILILVDGFLQFEEMDKDEKIINIVTILILVDGFLQFINNCTYLRFNEVTILILVDGFLQCSRIRL